MSEIGALVASGVVSPHTSAMYIADLEERLEAAERRLSVAGTRLMALTVGYQRGTHVQAELEAIMVAMREGGR